MEVEPDLQEERSKAERALAKLNMGNAGDLCSPVFQSILPWPLLSWSDILC